MIRENIPQFVELGRIKRKAGHSEFVDLRIECDKMGLTLERKGMRGYILQGLDLPTVGVECAILEDVKEEMINYGWEAEEII
jgi:hypothetical protein